MKNNKTLYILLGIGAGIGMYYFLCNRWKNKQKIAELQNNQTEQ